MTPERLRRIRAVYEAAVDTPAAGRPAVLERECDGDDELRQEVERLLGARERLPDWLSSPLLGGANVAPAETQPTVTEAHSSGQVHFPPGTVLAQRYRIVHLLGRGGMGEVYRADDLLLDQPVALKFLPAAATASASVLSRFRNEVRTARQVSHPNVCRVYDIGEAEGLTYLSMEYVDGEDLASLLRRIGKLPRDKALEIGRQLCAGLAAAHDKGVVHRDVKPANIMLDSRGHVRITDFGIAGMAEHIRDVRSGTPAYMSPEQLAGKEVTLRSDIYALGLVLHELLTGRRLPLEPVDGGTTDLEPAVEHVIRRCLEPDPHMRPGSALSVSAGLPGGDPLAAALARGETPVPEVVANAGTTEGLRPAVAVVCLASVIVGLGLLCVLRQRHDLINQIPMENSSEVLAAKAREIAKSFGYTERPVYTIFDWNYDADYLRYGGQQPQDRWVRDPSLNTPYQTAVYFWYRQSRHYPGVEYPPYLFNRDVLEPGMQAVVLDSEGRLLEFHARPPAESQAGIDAVAFDWSRLFIAAGLDSTRFKEVHPALTPTAAFDARAAWTGSAQGEEQRRVEAAAFQGRPVSFRVLRPWTRPSEPGPVSLGLVSAPAFIIFALAAPSAAALLAWRNVRSGRSDRRGAFRIAGFLSLFALLNYLAGIHHASSLAEVALLFAAMQYAVAAGCIGWLFYMAFEPQVRKRSPASLISWTRLLAGRFRDPMVGGHVLIGITLGILASFATNLLPSLPFVEGFAPLVPRSNAALFSLWCWQAITAVLGLGYTLILNLISIPVRRKWLAGAIFVALMTLLLSPGYGRLSFATVARPAILLAIVAFTLIRFGVLATVAYAYAQNSILEFPLTTNWSAFYAGAALLCIATILVLALYGFVTTLRGRGRSPSPNFVSNSG